MITAENIMTDQIVFVDPEESVERAINLMLRHGVSGLPVVDSSEQLVGVITEYDILDIIEDFHAQKNKVYQCMTHNPQTIDINTPATALTTIFQKRSIRRYPVVENGKLVGIISRRELIRLVHDIRIKVLSEMTVDVVSPDAREHIG